MKEDATMAMPRDHVPNEQVVAAKKHQPTAKLFEMIKQHEDNRINNLVAEFAPNPLQQWHTLTRSRQWAGRVQRLAHLLGAMGLADLQSLKEMFLKETSLAVSSCSLQPTISPPPSPVAAHSQEPVQFGSRPRVQRRINVGKKYPVVIGKDGESVAVVQRESGARIQVDKSTGTVTISGMEAQVAKANHLIDALVGAPEPRAAVHQQPSLVAGSPMHGCAELCSIANQLNNDERKCCNLVLEVAKRRLLAVLAELEREVPMTTADSGVVVHYRERRRQLDREKAAATRTRTHALHVACSRAAVGTIVGKNGVNLKRIGAEFGCKIVYKRGEQCFELKTMSPTTGVSTEALQLGKNALLLLEAKFHRDQAHWAVEQKRRQKQKLVLPGPDTWKEDATRLWHRHRRGKRKAANQQRQQIKIDSIRRSAQSGGRRSRSLKLDECIASNREMKKLLRAKSTKLAHRADIRVQVQMKIFDWTCPMKAPKSKREMHRATASDSGKSLSSGLRGAPAAA